MLKNKHWTTKILMVFGLIYIALTVLGFLVEIGWFLHNKSEKNQWYFSKLKNKRLIFKLFQIGVFMTVLGAFVQFGWCLRRYIQRQGHSQKGREYLVYNIKEVKRGVPKAD